MKLEQIKRLPEKKIRDVYNVIISTNNLVNVQTTKGKDLGIIDKDKYEYILTYSFPCQDLSLAGKRAGMNRDENTRSGMLWEVERILKECYELNQLPQVLLMENVPQVCGAGNEENFVEWQQELEKLGYKSYFEILNAKDYGIPQNRERCFMVSILGDYSYSFPKKIPLKLKLKDMLEDNVDEKYYLSDKMIKFFYENEKKQKEKGNGFKFGVTDGSFITKTITTRAGSRMDDNFIKMPKVLRETLENNDIRDIEDVAYVDGYNRNIRKDNLIGTITTRIDASKNSFLAIKEATKKGYKKVCDEDEVAVEDKINVIGNYSPSNHNASRIVDTNGIPPTFMGNHNTVTAVGVKLKKDTLNYIEWEQKGRLDCDCRAWKENCVAPTTTTTTTPNTKVLLNNLRIRKLTPKECYRLMGFDDEDYENAKKVLSDSMIYHTAGDSITINTLMAIFSQLLENERWEDKWQTHINSFKLTGEK